mgnify:CR=1 FL=1
MFHVKHLWFDLLSAICLYLGYGQDLYRLRLDEVLICPHLGGSVSRETLG